MISLVFLQGENNLNNWCALPSGTYMIEFLTLYFQVSINAGFESSIACFSMDGRAKVESCFEVLLSSTSYSQEY
jgi:hypothetical protein